ncbi:MAG: DUF3313 family protein [Halioglobus sp.]
MRQLQQALGFISLSIILTACTGTPTLEEKPSSEFAGLNEVSSSGFKEAWARPGADLQHYKVILISDLVSSDAEIRQPAASKLTRQDWVLTPARQQALSQDWSRAMSTAADERDISSTGEGEQVLRVDAQITRIAPNSDPQQAQSAPGYTRVYSEDSGEASIEIKLYDQTSNELLAVIRDNRRVGNRMWRLTSTVSASADVRMLFDSWSNRLLSRISGK